MKTIQLLLVFCLFLHCFDVEAQGVSINTSGVSPDNSAMLDISSTEKGVLFPRMTSVQRNAIVNPAVGLIIYQTDNVPGLYYYDATSWKSLGGGAGASCIDDLSDGKSDGSSVYLGNQAGSSDPGSYLFNTGVGVGALASTNSGDENTAVGHKALYSNLGGIGNTAIGYNALKLNTDGNMNTAVGKSALERTLADENTAIGFEALYSNIEGFNNTAIGIRTLYNNTCASNNTVIGHYAGRYNGDGHNNTIIGCDAGRAYEKSGNVLIGYQAGYYEHDNNKLYIENSDSDFPLIGGDFSTNKVTINDVLKLAPRITAPSNPTEGELYVNSLNHHIYCYLNGSWKQLD
ncbi:MAG: hypothetical protein KAT76_01475 [Bacteroidales bacterium]|nr:hypothetical protein [Bacteroidales bacterium]